MPRSESESLSEEKSLPFGQRVRRPRKNGLRLIAIFQYGGRYGVRVQRDRDREIQRMEREETHLNWIHKACIGQIY